MTRAATRWTPCVPLALLLGACAASAPPAETPPSTVEVGSVAELLDALQPVNAGRRIRVARGDYAVDRALQVPDHATLEGEGVMTIDSDGLPRGFEPGTETTLRVTAGFDGNVLALGNGSVLKGLRVIDFRNSAPSSPQRRGNPILVASRVPRDRVATSIVECEIVNPNAAGFNDTGPVGHGIVVLTLNPSLGAPPGAHVGAHVGVSVRRSIVTTSTGGVVFANNFAAHGVVAVVLEDNLLEGSFGATGGVSRPDAVTDATTRIESRHNLYRRTGYPHGWLLLGGSTSPHFTERASAGASRNRLLLESTDDRIEGFVTGIRAAAARRLGAASSPLADNRVEMRLRSTRIVTEGTGAADLVLRGTLSEVAQGQGPGEFPAGDRNVLSVHFDDVRGSGERQNEYADVVGPTRPEGWGSGNRLELRGDVGNLHHVNPVPDPRFFTAPRGPGPGGPGP